MNRNGKIWKKITNQSIQRCLFSSVPKRTNWLELNCSEVPRATSKTSLDMKVDQMIRAGHSIQNATNSLVAGQICAASAIHSADTSLLSKFKETEKNGVYNISIGMQHNRVRPSILDPIIGIFSNFLGVFSGSFGVTFAVASSMGVKMATSEYYNDQIREIFESMPDQTHLKDLFKQQRDDELKDIEDDVLLNGVNFESNAISQMTKKASQFLLYTTIQI